MGGSVEWPSAEMIAAHKYRTISYIVGLSRGHNQITRALPGNPSAKKMGKSIVSAMKHCSISDAGLGRDADIAYDVGAEVANIVEQSLSDDMHVSPAVASETKSVEGDLIGKYEIPTYVLIHRCTTHQTHNLCNTQQTPTHTQTHTHTHTPHSSLYN